MDATYPISDRLVFLCHGITATSKEMAPMASFLAQHGFSTRRPDFTPNDGSLSLRTYAEQLRHFINTHVDPGQLIDLVGFSMGAIIAQTYLQILQGYKRTRAFISVAGPHSGTALAKLAVLKGCRDMRPGSSLLKELAQSQSLLQGMSVSTIRSPFDLVIVPPESSILPDANNLEVGVPVHTHMMRSEEVHDLVLQELMFA